MSFQKEIRALQSQIDLNTNDLGELNRYVDFMISQNKSSKLHGYEYEPDFINMYKRKIKQLAENQRVLKYIIGEYIRMNRVFKE